jgi:hypothetical protein
MARVLVNQTQVGSPGNVDNKLNLGAVSELDCVLRIAINCASLGRAVVGRHAFSALEHWPHM